MKCSRTNGDTHLGGEDFDMRIVNHFVEQFKNQSGIDVKDDKAAMQRLKEEAEKAKKELSTTEVADINSAIPDRRRRWPQAL